jgi:GntR family transcriptional regulator/MocR family aminotransferase
MSGLYSSFAVRKTGARKGPLNRQLYREIREAVLSGRLSAGARLPSSRALSQQLELARNTVLAAYDQLIAEGYVRAKKGSGIYVSETLPGFKRQRSQTPHPRGFRRMPRSSARGKALDQLAPLLPPPNPVPFRHGFPALDEFPKKIWGRLMAKHWRKATNSSLGYGGAQGFFPLRRAIADYLSAVRGVKCGPPQVIVVAGSQQAIYLAGQVTLDPGDLALVEDPGYMGARAALLAAGATLFPAPVDEEGLNISSPAIQKQMPRVIYTTPSNQYPSTATMSLARRRSLLAWAYRKRAWILEDDYDSEYRYDSQPIAALQGLDTAGNVIYLGTFSKLLVPSLRLGYIVAPESLVDTFSAASAVITRHAPGAEQVVLAEFIEQGHLTRHVRKMKSIYQERQEALLASAKKYADGLLRIPSPAGGTHAIAELKTRHNDVRISQRAAEFGVECRPLSKYYLRPGGKQGLILGYGGFSPSAIDRGMRRLVESITSIR